MNDISVKIVESPKAAPSEGSPAGGAGAGVEVDPLAFEEDAAKETETPSDAKAVTCDDNAKEESTSEVQCVACENVEAVTETAEEKKLPEEESSPIDQPITEQHQKINLSEQSKLNSNTTVLSIDIEPQITRSPPKSDLISVKESPEPNPIPTEPVVVIIEELKPESPVIEVKEELLEKAATPEPPSVSEVPTEISVEEKSVIPDPQPTPQSPPKVADVEMVEVPLAVEEKKPEEKVVEKEKTVEIEKVVEGKLDQIEMKPAVTPTPVNGDVTKEDQATKRRASEEVDTDSPLKKLCQEVEKTFPQHDTMINDYIQTATKNNIDEIQRHTEQLLAEIQTLRELAQKKEHEWNNILHLKKVKEEILLRLLRRKQVLSFEKSADVNGSDRTDPFDYLNQAKNLAIDKSDEISGLAIKQPGSSPMITAPVMPVTTHFNPMAGLPPPYDKAAHAHMSMSKPIYPQPLMMPGPMPGFPRDMNGQLSNYNMQMGRQGPTKDVKSIIADYRQRNPDVTPRRGRRMKSILNPNMMNQPRPIAPKVGEMNNLNNLNMLFNNLDMNQKAMLERLQQIQAGGLPNSIFKDALVQFANMQQASGLIPPNRPPETITNRPEHHVKERRRDRNHEEHAKPERMPSTSPRLPPPPPYPEISLLPVTTSQESNQTQNSLLHGILTKPAPPQSFSPTLAKLLTSPERKSASAQAPVLPTFGQAKNCGEITITPVQPAVPPQPEPQPEKTEEVVQLDDEESPASEGEPGGSPSGSGSGRLVIDETGGTEAGGAAGEGEAEAETPLCQGCRRRDAQFVCAGCANQWYCSRECQVAAWDEHSEMCSG